MSDRPDMSCPIKDGRSCRWEECTAYSLREYTTKYYEELEPRIETIKHTHTHRCWFRTKTTETSEKHEWERYHYKVAVTNIEHYCTKVNNGFLHEMREEVLDEIKEFHVQRYMGICFTGRGLPMKYYQSFVRKAKTEVKG